MTLLNLLYHAGGYVSMVSMRKVKKTVYKRIFWAMKGDFQGRMKASKKIILKKR